MPAGRPTKYTPEIVAEVLRLTRMGVPRKYAALGARIAEDTLYEWEKKHPEFSESLEYADADFVIGHMQRMNSDRRGNTLSLQILKSHPRTREHFSEKHSVEHSGDAAAPMEIVVRYTDATH